MKRTFVINSCIALLVLLFAYTGSSKYLEHEKFIFQMELAPVPYVHLWAPFLSRILPALELIIAGCLLIEKYRIATLYASTVLLLLFEVYIAIMLFSGLHLPCTCGGIISHLSWKNHLIFNAVFIGLSITAIYLIKKETKARQHSIHPATIKELSRA